MREPSGRKTRSDLVYERMRADIFAARLQPGQRLNFRELCATYDTSVGVAREVLARLAVERLVRPQPQQGFTVTALSAEELQDLTTARVEIEALAFRSAVQNGSVEWEADVVAAHHRLCRLPMVHPGSPDEEWENWAGAHEAFHAALLAGCPNRRLRETAQSLRGEAELYRRWVAPLGDHSERDVAAEHQALADAALARDVERASQLLCEHISRTTEILLRGQNLSADSHIA